MSHLAIEAVGAKHGGAASVLADVITASLATPGLERITVFASPHELREFEFPQDASVSVVEPAWAERGIGRMAWYLAGLEQALRASRAETVLLLSGVGLAPSSIASGVFVQQSLPFSQEARERLSVRGRVRVGVIESMMRLTCGRASRVFVQSETMRQWVSQRFALDRRSVEVARPSTVLPPPEYGGELERMEAAPRGKRLLYVGSDSPYKNLEVVYRAMQEVALEDADACLFATIPESSAGRGASRSRVIPLGRLRRSQVSAAYRLATAIVMPSLVETVGYPLLEAASLGVPAIAADRPYAHEVCGDGALYFDPNNHRELASAIRKLCADRGLVEALGARASRRSAERGRLPAHRQMIESLLALRPEARS
jgi:glycosyltransferase involved in cell wall biosynthesis